MAAGLPSIDLLKLQENDAVEKEHLLSAAKTQGFFYLDLRNVQDSSLLKSSIDRIYTLEEQLYDLDLDEKMRYDIDVNGPMKTSGYKPLGRNHAGLKNGQDGFETYAIPRDGVLGINSTELRCPNPIKDALPNLQTFVKAMDMIADTVHKSLSSSLGLTDQRLEDFHRLDKPAPTILRLLKYHAQPHEEQGNPHAAHTDLGSLTLLFTKQPGLQVLSQETGQWSYVEPKADHAIVNIGDVLSLKTNGLLHSSVHRVGPAPGRSMETRWSFAYLQRPEASTPMAAFDTPQIRERQPLVNANLDVAQLTSGEWLQHKFGALRKKTHNVEKNDWVMTGSVETADVKA